MFSHSDLSTEITWGGQELSWSTGFSRLKSIPLSFPSPLCVHNPSFQGVRKPRKTHYWSQSRTHVCSAVISSDVSHNSNMNFSFISSPLRGEVAFHVDINFSNAWWHCGIYMAGWSGVFCSGFIYSYPLHWSFLNFFFKFCGIFSLFRTKELHNLGKRSPDGKLHFWGKYQIRSYCEIS